MRVASIVPLLAALPYTLSWPSQPPFANTTTLPTNFGVLVFDHFQALDVFGPLDVFNTLAMLFRNSTTMYLSVLSKTMEPPSTGMRMMVGSMEQRILPTTTFEEYLAGGKKDSDIEVLIVPGGAGTRFNVTSEISFVRALYPKLKYLISVCTGATIVARAGVLDGKKATTNKRSWTWAVQQGPNVKWVPTARWVEDGNVFSSSGISAGIDVAYAFISRIYGEEVAEYVALASEYNRVKDEHDDPFAKVWDVPGAT